MRIIAGPCQHESYVDSLEIIEKCKETVETLGGEYIFKASFDKANRTSGDSVRGNGLKRTLNDFYKLKSEIEGLKILTDVHETYQIDWIEEEWPGIIDVYQIPAFLCRQTDLIQRACATGKIINIKKGQFLAPWDVAGIYTKTEGAKEVWITERGTSFGYNRLVVDFIGMQYLIDTFGSNIIFDATHSVQEPGGLGGSSGGARKYVPGLCRAAAGLGIKNFFLEEHENPEKAKSDGPNALYLHNFEPLIEDIAAIIDVHDKRWM